MMYIIDGRKSHEDGVLHWAKALCLIARALVQPSSAAAERVFSLYINTQLYWIYNYIER